LAGGTAIPISGLARENTSYFNVYHASVDETYYCISGDVILNSEPTWAAANMEGVTAVDVYIPPASAGIAGLVNNAAGNTAGTPILGKTDGVAVAAGYVGETWGILGSTTSVGTQYNLANKTVPVGLWRIDITEILDVNMSSSTNAVGCNFSENSGSYGTEVLGVNTIITRNTYPAVGSIQDVKHTVFFLNVKSSTSVDLISGGSVVTTYSSNTFYLHSTTSGASGITILKIRCNGTRIA